MELLTAFSKTFRALDRTRPVGVFLRLFTALAALAALGYWIARVPVALYETSLAARLEIETAAAVIQSQMTGRIVESNLVMGKDVKKDDILVRLDSLPEELQVREERTRLRGVEPQIAALRAQITQEENAGRAEQQTAASQVAEAEAKVREQQAPVQAAKVRRARLAKMLSEKLIPEKDLEDADAEVERLARAVSTVQASIDRIRREQAARDEERLVRIATIRSDIAKLESAKSNSVAAVQRADYDVEQKLIRAPISGRIGEASILRTGAVLLQGTRVGSIVPSGQLKIVASFPPQAVFGRLHEGAHAKMRLRGYPWMEFGVIEAEVSKVASEDRDDKARVELRILEAPARIPLTHGMPGEVEVEVERTPPLALILRTAGQWMTGPAAAPSSGEAPKP
ncbi:MAG: HlyD family efflux transporter periplasmic adaptor subunit [Acidobacteria bacterium]|nr:HlyD family efflux transporter periplasmic adaptor subunit [Acidobacteriota bacterium]